MDLLQIIPLEEQHPLEHRGILHFLKQLRKVQDTVQGKGAFSQVQRHLRLQDKWQ